MNARTSASPTRLAVGAILLMLAATASGCGSALPTQPEIDSGASLHRSAATTQMADSDGSLELGDLAPPTGGPDQTQQPPAGEEVLPSLTHNGNGVAHAWGWYRKNR